LELQEAVLAHEVIVGLSKLFASAKEACKMLERPLEEIEGRDWFELREMMEEINAELEGQVHQASTLLAYLRGEEAVGGSRPQMVLQSPVEVVRDMVPSYMVKAKRCGIDVEVALDDEECPQYEVEVFALRRAFHNIMSNAIKYSHTSRQESRRFIRIWAERDNAEGTDWAIKVQNFGLGILESERSKVGTPGFRGSEAVKRNTFGTGLGVYHARQCMKNMGGHLRVTSDIQHGSTYLTTVALVFAGKGRARRG
jgi:signal transduction histidine kinase